MQHGWTMGSRWHRPVFQSGRSATRNENFRSRRATRQRKKEESARAMIPMGEAGVSRNRSGMREVERDDQMRSPNLWRTTARKEILPFPSAGIRESTRLRPSHRFLFAINCIYWHRRDVIALIILKISKRLEGEKSGGCGGNSRSWHGL